MEEDRTRKVIVHWDETVDAVILELTFTKNLTNLLQLMQNNAQNGRFLFIEFVFSWGFILSVANSMLAKNFFLSVAYGPLATDIFHNILLI